MEKNKTNKFVIYRYTKNSDGSFEMIDRQMFDKLSEAESCYAQITDEMSGGLLPHGSVELDREIYYKGDMFMHDSEMIQKFDNSPDFAVS